MTCQGFSSRRRHLLFGTVALFVTGISSTVWALSSQDAEAIIASLSQVQSVSYQTLNAYYQFSSNPGDKELQGIIEEKSAELKARITGLSQLAGAADMAAEIGTLQAMREDYARLLDTNVGDLLNQGYPDIRLVAELDAANLTQVKGAQLAIDQAREYGGAQPDPVIEKVRESRLLLLGMTTRYSARSASTVSQVFQGTEGELSLEEQSQRFTANLDALQASFAANAKARKALDGVRSKWGFISRSIVNYTENDVPFVVNLYATKIVELLDELEGLR